MMLFKIGLFFVVLFVSVSNACDLKYIEPVDDFVEHKFLGVWYEIRQFNYGQPSQNHSFTDYAHQYTVGRRLYQLNYNIFSRKNANADCEQTTRTMIKAPSRKGGYLEINDGDVTVVRIMATNYKYYAVIFRCSRIEDEMCLNPEVSIYSRKSSLLNKHMDEAMGYAEDLCIDFRKYVDVTHTKACVQQETIIEEEEEEEEEEE